MYTGEDLAKLAKEILSKKWGYIFGRAGIKWTAEMQAEIDRSTDSKYDSARKYGRKWIGHYVADCSGLVKYICRQFKVTVPHGSNSQWRDSLFEKGAISGNAVPVGALVFKLRNGDDFYHVGIYVGGGNVVEAQGTQTGVVSSRLASWTHYGLVKGIGYSEKRDEVIKLKPGAAYVDVPNDGTVNIRKAPSGNSTKLGTLREGSECEVVSVEGDWAEVRYSASGYIMSRYLKNKEV
jgi:hypothetical protein